MLYGCYIHEKDYEQYDFCYFVVYSREMINMFFIGQVLVLVENVNIEIYSDTIYVVNVSLCTMVLLIEFYLFIPLWVTLTIFQGHSNVK